MDVHRTVVVFDDHTDGFHTITVMTFLLGGVNQTVLDVSFAFEIVAFIDDDLIVLTFDVEGDDSVFSFDFSGRFDGVVDAVGEEIVELTGWKFI